MHFQNALCACHPEYLHLSFAFRSLQGPHFARSAINIVFIYTIIQDNHIYIIVITEWFVLVTHPNLLLAAVTHIKSYTMKEFFNLECENWMLCKLESCIQTANLKELLRIFQRIFLITRLLYQRNENMVQSSSILVHQIVIVRCIPHDPFSFGLYFNLIAYSSSSWRLCWLKAADVFQQSFVQSCGH